MESSKTIDKGFIGAEVDGVSIENLNLPSNVVPNRQSKIQVRIVSGNGSCFLCLERSSSFLIEIPSKNFHGAKVTYNWKNLE
jgi:hypothetical protein